MPVEELGTQAPTVGSPGPQKTKIDESQFRSRNENRAKKVWLPKQKLIRWETFCTVHQIDFKDLVENALDLFMQQYEVSAGLGAQAPNIKINDLKNDDEVIFSLPSSSDLNSGLPGSQLSYEEQKARSCLEFYANKTGNVIKPRDRHAYEQGHDELPGVITLPEHIIRFGIMMSILKCRKKIWAFSYCLGQIHQAVEDGVTPQIAELFERTFDVRLTAKNIVIQDPNNPKNVTPEYAEYVEKLKAAAAGAQPSLPGTGADLVEGEFKSERTE